MTAHLQRLLRDDEHLRELFTKSGINLVFRVGGKFVRILFVWLIIRWFGSPLFGEWSLALTILAITTVMANLGIKLSIVRFVAEAQAQDEPGKLRDAYLKSLVLLSIGGCLFGLALYLSSSRLALAFQKSGLEELLQIVAFGVLPFNIVMLNSGALRGLRRTTAHSFVETTGIPLFAAGLLVVGYAAFEHGYLFALAYVSSLWLIAGVSFLMWARLSRFMKSPASAAGSLGYRELLNVSLPMLVNDSVRLVKSWADVIMIGFFCSDLELAAYCLVLRVSALIMMPLMAVNSIAAAKFAEFHGREDVSGMARIARQSTRIIFWLSLPILLIVVLFSKPVLGIFDSDLTMGAMALVIIGFGYFFSAISGSVFQILNMTGHQHALRNIVLLTGFLNVALNFILIPIYGIVGAAIATSFTLVLTNSLCLYQIKKVFNFVPFYVPMLGA